MKAKIDLKVAELAEKQRIRISAAAFLQLWGDHRPLRECILLIVEYMPII